VGTFKVLAVSALDLDGEGGGSAGGGELIVPGLLPERREL